MKILIIPYKIFLGSEYRWLIAKAHFIVTVASVKQYIDIIVLQEPLGTLVPL